MIIKNAKVVLEDRVILGGVRVIEDVITEVFSGPCPYPLEDSIDFQGDYLLPGFIDIHTHGIGGYDVMDSSIESITKIGESLLSVGVTSYLPTILTESRDNIKKSLDNIRDAMGSHKGVSSNILGVHVEGPFFSNEYKGAQNPNYLLEGSISNYNSIFKSYEDIIKIFSLAPEVSNIELVDHLVDKEIIVGMAHTKARANTAKEYIDRGASHLVHAFNGMTPIHHREPSVIGKSLIDPRVYLEVILDGNHLSYDIFKLILLCKGIDRVILISDSMAAALLSEGRYSLGGQDVIVKDRCARVPSGSLAGSLITLLDAFKNAILVGGLDITKASKLTSTNPAKHLNIPRLGAIKVGYYSDLIRINSKLELREVFLRGVKV